jgi:predicted nucleic acid-binding protein
MRLTPGSAVFLDTNILVYASFPSRLLHAAAVARLAEFRQWEVVFWISRQILREFLAATTRPGAIDPAPSVSVLTRTVRDFAAGFTIAQDNSGVTAQLLDILETVGAQGKQVHDANIVATMRQHRILYLLTQNVTDFQRYASWITVLPLVS